MTSDIWHYPRTELAKQVLGMFESGLSSALVFFAPRRMGKTEFLLKDMRPLAHRHHWPVLYFSFLDVGVHAKEVFTSALVEFAIETKVMKWEKFQKRIKKIEAGISGVHAGFEFRDPNEAKTTLKEIMQALAKQPHKTLLLLDEVQILALDEKNKYFVAALRTVLDIYKDSIKVIFTGSSQEGLRRMFSKSDAPFFHFGQNLPFPEMPRDFIEHLVTIFHRATHRNLDAESLWKIFLKMNRVPQLIRSLVERLALHPDLTVQQAEKQLLQDLIDDREYATIWDNSSVLEQLLLKTITRGEKELFSEAKRLALAQKLGIDELSVSMLQSTIRSLKRKTIVGSLPERGGYSIDDPNFKNWIEQMTMGGENKLF